MFAEGEICYRGKSRFVRRLCASRGHIVGDTDLVLESRGMLDNLSVLSFDGYTDEIPHDAVEVSVHALSLNFKDVLNVILPDKAAYAERALPGSDFSGVVTAVLMPTQRRNMHFL